VLRRCCRLVGAKVPSPKAGGWEAAVRCWFGWLSQFYRTTSDHHCALALTGTLACTPHSAPGLGIGMSVSLINNGAAFAPQLGPPTGTASGMALSEKQFTPCYKAWHNHCKSDMQDDTDMHPTAPSCARAWQAEIGTRNRKLPTDLPRARSRSRYARRQQTFHARLVPGRQQCCWKRQLTQPCRRNRGYAQNVATLAVLVLKPTNTSHVGTQSLEPPIQPHYSCFGLLSRNSRPPSYRSTYRLQSGVIPTKR
jgi:hypothetical protein